MRQLFYMLLSFFTISHINASEYDICTDLIIDQTHEIAYGPHGIPYTGKITCYRDKDKNMMKYERAFENGKPIGLHICYTREGKKRSFINYNNTKKTRGFYLNAYNASRNRWPEYTICGGEPEECRYERPCMEHDKDCKFSCN